jgi:hypothetical protein
MSEREMCGYCQLDKADGCDHADLWAALKEAEREELQQAEIARDALLRADAAEARVAQLSEALKFIGRPT